MYKRNYLVLSFVLLCSVGFGQGNATVKKVDKMLAMVIKKVMPATVKIAAFDTLSQTIAVSRFSGVLVSMDGLILTAAHATQPKQIYQVCFPGGRKVLAKGLGRISLGEDKPATDVAMLQIIEKGKWPFAEMAYSSEMRAGQPCIGISFPGTFDQLLPNVRLGRLENVDIDKGNFQSSCKMEPGDSGGALFDAKGRLIGIHSWILSSEQQNFEVPIDLYHKYWDALHIPISYDHLPQANTDLSINRSAIVDSIPPLDLLAQIKPLDAAAVVRVNSVVNGHVKYFLFGTVLLFQQNGKAFQTILTKSSSIGEETFVSFGGKQVAAKVICRDQQNDLALLRIDEDLPRGIDVFSEAKPGDTPLGKMLFSAFPDEKAKAGIASTGYIGMSLKYSIGYFGAKADFIDGKVTVTDIPKGCPADGMLRKHDQIISINGVTLNSAERYSAEIEKYFPDDTISMDAIRDGQKIQLIVRMGMSRPLGRTSDAFLGGRSLRSDGFRKVIAQDAAIKASECGGPVFNAKGQFVGINIGRHSRTSTIIMPRDVIAAFCKLYISMLIVSLK